MSSDKTQNKSRKTNKVFQNLTREDLNQLHHQQQVQQQNIRVDTRGLHEDYGTIPLHNCREDREDSRRPALRVSPPSGHQMLRSPAIDGYYQLPVFYSPPAYYPPRSSYMPPYYSPQGNYYSQPNPQQNPVIFVSSPPYTPTESYSSPPQSNDQYSFGNRLQSYPPVGSFLSTPTTPTHTRSPAVASIKGTPKSSGAKKSKNNKSKGQDHVISISMIKGHVLEIAVDQTKCRELQHYLKEGGTEGSNHYTPSHVLQIIFDEVCHHAFTIVVNPFGNYLFQKVYECSTHEQRILLLRSLIVSTRLADASCNKHGSRCVQHMIKYSVDFPDLVDIIVQSLSQHIYRLCVDENGNHVVQYCLEKLSVDQNFFIFNLISQSCLDICKQRYGNRVMQRCIQCAVDGQCPDFTLQIVDQAYDLITDEFGNYIIQHMLFTCPHHVEAICRAVVGSITSLSKQKHASVVIEKCFQSGTSDVLRLYLEEISHPENLSTLIQDQFGNYVIQNALKYLPSDLKHRFVETLMKFIDLIKQMPWGLQIISKMCSDSSIISPALATSVMPTDTAPTPSTVLL